MRARHDHPSDPSTASTASVRNVRPTNRAERRAAARGRNVTTTADVGRPATGTSGPGVQVKPRHTRTDYAARRSG